MKVAYYYEDPDFPDLTQDVSFTWTAARKTGSRSASRWTSSWT